MFHEVDGTTPTRNSPLRGGKATVFEGGVHTPLTIAWPGVTAAGSKSDACEADGTPRPNNPFQKCKFCVCL
jgi:arylsulfatase A-like enzyme